MYIPQQDASRPTRSKIKVKTSHPLQFLIYAQNSPRRPRCFLFSLTLLGPLVLFPPRVGPPPNIIHFRAPRPARAVAPDPTRPLPPSPRLALHKPLAPPRPPANFLAAPCRHAVSAPTLGVATALRSVILRAVVVVVATGGGALAARSGVGGRRGQELRERVEAGGQRASCPLGQPVLLVVLLILRARHIQAAREKCGHGLDRADERERERERELLMIMHSLSPDEQDAPALKIQDATENTSARRVSGSWPDLLEAEPSLLGALRRPVHHGVLLVELLEPAPRDPRSFYKLPHAQHKKETKATVQH